MANKHFFSTFKIFDLRFCDFGLSILLEYYKFSIVPIRKSDTCYEIEVIIMINHRIDMLYYCNIIYILSSSKKPNNLIIGLYN